MVFQFQPYALLHVLYIAGMCYGIKFTSNNGLVNYQPSEFCHHHDTERAGIVEKFIVLTNNLCPQVH